jgi:hypothetical protein
MTKPDTGVEAEMEAFADELSDEALDRADGRISNCCFSWHTPPRGGRHT